MIEYEELAILNNNEEYPTVLVRKKGTERLFVKKIVPCKQGGIYEQAAEINSKFLVPIEDIYYEQDKCIVVSDYISGISLREAIEQGGRLSQEETLQYMRQILEGVSKLHQYRIVHRDIKPENILISIDDVVRVADYGIARFQREGGNKDTKVLGTVGYASPEQFGFRQTDARTDIYALGVLMNVMLTGKMPDEEMPKDADLYKVIKRCTHIDPEKRYQSVLELQSALQKFWRKDGLQIDVDDRQMERWGLPGYKTGKKSIRILATIGYALMLTLILLYPTYYIEYGIGVVLLEMLSMFILLGGMFFCLSNMWWWDRKIWGVRRLPRELCVAVRILCSFICLDVGLEINIYAQQIVQGISKIK